MSEQVIKNKVAAYLLLNQEEKNLKAAKERLKAELEPYLQQAEENSKGSKVIAFSEPLEIDGTRYKSLQKTRKESKVLNEERTIAWLKDKQNSMAEEDAGWDDLVDSSGVIVYVEHIDQDALWDLFVQDMITQEELDSFFDTTLSWAFNPTKE